MGRTFLSKWAQRRAYRKRKREDQRAALLNGPVKTIPFIDPLVAEMCKVISPDEFNAEYSVRPCTGLPRNASPSAEG